MALHDLLAETKNLPELNDGDRAFVNNHTAADLADLDRLSTAGLIVGYWRARNNDQPVMARKLKAAVEASGAAVDQPLDKV